MARKIKRSAEELKRKIISQYSSFRRAPRLRISQRRIFVDCGANTCTILRSFVKELPDFEFFAFEAQPELKAEGEKVATELANTKIRFADKAVWTRNEQVDFYLATQWGPNYKGGSTLMSGNTMNNSAISYETPVRVDAFDFSEWLAENFCQEDYVIVKMDIEGAEYDVLEKVIQDGNLPIIDELIIEFHYRMNEGISKKRHDSLVKTLKDSCRVEIWH